VICVAPSSCQPDLRCKQFAIQLRVLRAWNVSWTAFAHPGLNLPDSTSRTVSTPEFWPLVYLRPRSAPLGGSPGATTANPAGTSSWHCQSKASKTWGAPDSTNCLCTRDALSATWSSLLLSSSFCRHSPVYLQPCDLCLKRLNRKIKTLGRPVYFGTTIAMASHPAHNYSAKSSSSFIRIWLGSKLGTCGRTSRGRSLTAENQSYFI
jgi:hypothetical protein